jgi:hypothetical protein
MKGVRWQRAGRKVRLQWLEGADCDAIARTSGPVDERAIFDRMNQESLLLKQVQRGTQACTAHRAVELLPDLLSRQPTSAPDQEQKAQLQLAEFGDAVLRRRVTRHSVTNGNIWSAGSVKRVPFAHSWNEGLFITPLEESRTNA